MKFWDYTLALSGSIFASRVQESSALSAAAVEVFATMLDDTPPWRKPIPHSAASQFELQLTPYDEGEPEALFTFWRGPGKQRLITTGALLPGIDAGHDGVSIEQLQSTILQVSRRTAIEPAFDAAKIARRPAVVSIPFPADPEDIVLVADMETCLAAAWFGRVFSSE